jgi:hypothetical protein
MMATAFEIVDRPYERPIPLADVQRHFRLRETGQVPVGTIGEIASTPSKHAGVLFKRESALIGQRICLQRITI